MIKAILFDLWNTLIYDTENKHKMLIACLREAGIDNPHDFQDRFLCSRSFKDLNEVANLISDKTGCSRQKALEIVRENASQNAKLFPDVASALGGLRKDYKLAIISNFMDFTASAVEKSGIESFFDYRFYSCRIG
jgi:FMN phosphatase YigB (HAD superfamily)